MLTLPRLQQDVLQNPIADAQIKHIKRQGMGWFWRLLYIVTILAILAPLYNANDPYFQRGLGEVVAVLLLLNFAGLLAVELRAINLADKAIAREFTGRTWELLIMSGVDTWRVVLGKWLGVVRTVLPDYGYVYVLRICTLFWASAMTNLQFRGFGTYWNATNGLLADVQVNAGAFAIACVVTAFFMFLEMLMITAIPLVFSLMKRTRKNASIITLTLRIAVPMVFGAFVLWQAGYFQPYYAIRYTYTPEQVNTVAGFALSLGDNGLMTVMSVLNDDAVARNLLPQILPGQIFGVIVMILTTVFSLWIATVAAHRQNVSQPGFSPKPKPKRQPTS